MSHVLVIESVDGLVDLSIEFSNIVDSWKNTIVDSKQDLFLGEMMRSAYPKIPDMFEPGCKNHHADRYRCARMACVKIDRKTAGVYAHAFWSEEAEYVKIGCSGNLVERLKELKADAKKKFNAIHRYPLLYLPVKRMASLEYLEDVVLNGISSEFRVNGESEWFYDTVGVAKILHIWFVLACMLQSRRRSKEADK